MAMKLFIGKLSHDAVEQDLDDLFKPYGPLNKVVVKPGYGFVEYQNAEDADAAIRNLHGHILKGSAILVQQAKGPKDNRNRIPKTEYRVLVEGINAGTSWQDLKDFAREAGKPIFTDIFTRAGERVGVIEYERFDDMENALRKLDDADLKGNRVRVIEERRAEQRRSAEPRYDYDRRGRSYDRDYGRERDYYYGNRRDDIRGDGWSGDRYPRSDPRRSRSRGRGGYYRDDFPRRSHDRDYRR